MAKTSKIKVSLLFSKSGQYDALAHGDVCCIFRFWKLSSFCRVDCQKFANFTNLVEWLPHRRHDSSSSPCPVIFWKIKQSLLSRPKLAQFVQNLAKRCTTCLNFKLSRPGVTNVLIWPKIIERLQSFQFSVYLLNFQLDSNDNHTPSLRLYSEIDHIHPSSEAQCVSHH